MEKYTPRKNKNTSNNLKITSKNRFWGNATRLEHVNNRNKNKSRKGK
jgi:hypothetical protein